MHYKMPAERGVWKPETWLYRVLPYKVLFAWLESIGYIYIQNIVHGECKFLPFQKQETDTDSSLSLVFVVLATKFPNLPFSS